MCPCSTDEEAGPSCDLVLDLFPVLVLGYFSVLILAHQETLGILERASVPQAVPSLGAQHLVGATQAWDGHFGGG